MINFQLKQLSNLYVKKQYYIFNKKEIKILHFLMLKYIGKYISVNAQKSPKIQCFQLIQRVKCENITELFEIKYINNKNKKDT